MFARPTEQDYAPYYRRYISRVPAGDLLAILAAQGERTSELLRSQAGLARAEFRYAPGKWSLKQVVGHVSDVERVMAYRVLRFGRRDATPLPGFDDPLYAEAGEFDARDMTDLLDEFLAVRRATISLLAGLPQAAWSRRGEASGAEFSVLALACIIAGHELHHCEIVQSRYLAHPVQAQRPESAGSYIQGSSAVGP